MERDGLLLIDKPGGMTSHDVVAKIRRWLGQKSVGHAGTLDPLATGLLVILVGKATKLSDFVLNGDKGYQVKVQLGYSSDTDDITGEVKADDQAPLINEDNLREVACGLSGDLQLQVPIYSAIKQKGKKLYELARKKQKVEAPVRSMRIFDLRVDDCGQDWLKVDFKCSKGTYVRSWSRELGQRLRCGAVVEELRRHHSSPYQVSQALPLGELLETDPEQMENQGAWIPLAQSLPQLPAIKIEGREEKLLVNGQIPRRLERYLEIRYGDRQDPLPGIRVLSRKSGKLLSILSQESPLNFKIRRVFHS